MSDEAKAFMAIGESFAKHETVKHSSHEYVRDTVHVNLVEGFNSGVRRTIAGVFHHISPQHADLYFDEIGFAGPSASCLEVRFGKLGTAGKSCERSGRGCRRRCNCRLSFGPQRGVRCAEAPMAASSSNQPLLSLVDKGRVLLGTVLVPTPNRGSRFAICRDTVAP
jgi:hypothetical protein